MIIKHIDIFTEYFYTAFRLEIDSVPEFCDREGTSATLGAFGGNGGTPVIPVVVDLRRIDAKMELADARRRRRSLNDEFDSFLSDFSIFHFFCHYLSYNI